MNGRLLHIALPLIVAGCGTAPSTPSTNAPAPKPSASTKESRLADLRQLTFGGENAEAYWSFDGKQLIFQSRKTGEGCDQIFRMLIDKPNDIKRVSNGQGVTTCSYFLPGDQQVIYASTHLAGAACPPRPDHSQGYVWALYDSFDIFKANADGSGLTRLTDAPGYDAEATVCAKDGSIVFTSVRDGDIDLYRMDKDGKNVVRLTNTPGYDGGAFFNRDCSKIVWRASRPSGKALEDYQRLLKQGLVRPTQLELYVGNADGSDARQVTYLGTASFAPYWFPNQDRIIFSSNYPDPRGREFDLWAIDVDGTDLERITFTPGFDGFPMFSPDGKTLAFASNRATAPDKHDTNVFLARWRNDAPGKITATAADRVQKDIAWLADPTREGRGIGTRGLEAAGAYIEKRFGELGLAPLAGGGYRQKFEVVTGSEVATGTKASIDDQLLPEGSFRPLAGSPTAGAEGDMVFADWGIRAENVRDDYAKVQAKGKIVLVRRFAPDSLSAEDKRRYSDLRYKAWVARQQGAQALVVVDSPPAAAGEKPAEEAPFPPISEVGTSEASIPMIIVTREVGQPLIAKLAGKRRVKASVSVALRHTTSSAFNVVGKLPAKGDKKSPGAIVVGAHYDHLGMGGHGSLAPDVKAPHLGADDNASGTAALLEVARVLAAEPSRPRDVWFVAFSAEEIGVLGSKHFVEHLPQGLANAEAIVAMLNMDMVGRMQHNRLSALGGGTADEWPALVGSACEAAGVLCTTDESGYGPSDQTSFYVAGIPVLHFFTGAHTDYHKPSDSADRINAAGAGRTAEIVAAVAKALPAERLTFRRVPSPPPAGDLRGYGASLGSIPDYVGPKSGQPGVLLADVRPGGAAELGGLKKGDILVKLGTFEIGSVHELMFALRASKPGETVKAAVIRDGKRIEADVTFQKSTQRPR
ncbi:MAG TPA: M20/M25/M40 family metallo-hydrolase [Polyangiaceae bacterium]|nr:M20/M25/M40 family metallo-hydrolase [Polyangiaceae bacterium]